MASLRPSLSQPELCETLSQEEEEKKRKQTTMKKGILGPDMVTHTFSRSTEEAETGGAL